MTTYNGKDYRGLTKATLDFFGVVFNNDEVVFPYGPKASKVRKLSLKDFRAEGEFKEASCFGRDKFTSGQAKAITITEGELDAMSVYQMMGKYPVVSIKGASSATKDIKLDYEFINSFEKIYLCLDNDEPGQKALKQIAGMFDPNKIYHVKLDKFKDANDYLTNGCSDEFSRAWWGAKKYLPKGILSGADAVFDVLKQAKNETIATYPFPTLNEMLYGIRLGELVLFTAQEKVGKTEVLRAIEHHLVATTDHRIGIIHLEEEEKRCVEGLIGYHVKLPAHLPDSGLSVDDKLKAYKELEREDGRVHFYSHFGSDDPDTILDVIRYLVAVCGCKFIFLDHITMLVTGYEGDDERKKLDYISTRLAMLTRELNFALFLVSHVNDDGKTRGSRNISKVADAIISLDRDVEAPTVEERNVTRLLAKGVRFSGRSGPAGNLFFDPKTYTLAEIGGTVHEQPTGHIKDRQELVRESKVVQFTGYGEDTQLGGEDELLAPPF